MQRLSLARSRRWLLVVLLWGLAGNRLLAQEPGNGVQSVTREVPLALDNAATFVDNAIPGNVLRLRGDAAFDDHHPSRGEWFWAKPGLGGVPLTDPKVNHQEMSGYLELMVADCLSLFAEAPVRFLDPQVNATTTGFGDINFGFKWALVQDGPSALSFQFRTYAPTGDAHRGLGNDHYSLEPGILGFLELGEGWAVAADCLYVYPVDGSDIAGQLVHYGVSLQYCVYECEHLHITPLVEAAGWTFLTGKDIVVLPDGTSITSDAMGQTILDVNAGVRIGVAGHFDAFAGYSQPVLNDKSYNQGFRVELRFAF